MGQQPPEDAGALPRLKPAMAGLVRRIAGRQVVPRRPRPQYPEHTVHDGAGVLPRAAAAIGTTARAKERFENLPLLVSEVHAIEYDGPRLFVHKPHFGFMR